MVSLHSSFTSCLRLVLKPIIRFCLRYGIKIQDVQEACKILYTELAEKELEKSKGQVTDSKISVMTGIHRRDVKRIRGKDYTYDSSRGLIMKVVGNWLNHPSYTTKAGKPKVLTFGYENSDFNKLVQSVSKDLNPATILFELKRVLAIEEVKNGVKLLAESYSPSGNIEEGVAILGADVDYLFQAAEENIFESAEIPNLHRRTEYDNIRPEGIAEIQEELLKEGFVFHRKIRRLLSKHDQDLNPKKGFRGKGVKVVLGTFSKVLDSEEDA